MNRQYEEMRIAAINKLKDRLPEDLAAKGNLNFNREKQEFCFSLFGTKMILSYPDFTFTPEPNMWLALTVYQYLDEADGTPLSMERMALTDFKDGGLIRGASFDRENDKIIQQVTKGKSLEEIMKAIKAQGGKQIEGKADFCAEFSFMPNFPIYLNLWFADDEFPASCKILFNKSAEHYLKVEAAGTISGILLSGFGK